LPWHLKITQGAVQVSDSLGGSFTFVWPNTTRTPGANASRAVAESWTVVPETNAKILSALRDKYTLAVSTFDANYESGSTPPAGRPYGRFEKCTVWVKEEHLAALLELTTFVLKVSPVQPGERALQLPSLPIAPR